MIDFLVLLRDHGRAKRNYIAVKLVGELEQQGLRCERNKGQQGLRCVESHGIMGIDMCEDHRTTGTEMCENHGKIGIEMCGEPWDNRD